ncbi:surf-like protein [Tulasnella sp. 419]|nr:surf-like protein [Tulasnella sp. 418]KAG8965588.1 surf-like protein [Tulasnella sp. 419]
MSFLHLRHSFNRNAALRSWKINKRNIATETASFNTRAKAKATSWSSPAKLILGFIPIFTFGLGTWQVQRLRWKTKLIEELEDKLERESMSLPKQINMAALPEFQFRRVTVSGTWDHAHSILVGPRTKDKQVGYHLITPLIRGSGASTILVDRGFVTQQQAESALKKGSDGSEVQLIGMLRSQPERNAFTPENKPEKGEWHWVDIQQIVDYVGGKGGSVQPVLVEAIFDGNVVDMMRSIRDGIPVGRAPTVDIRNEHMSYIVTWYSLSVATSFMFWKLISKGRR